MFVSYLAHLRAHGAEIRSDGAETGPIGGNLSHEFIILAETGESEVYCHKDLVALARLAPTSTMMAIFRRSSLPSPANTPPPRKSMMPIASRQRWPNRIV